MFFNNKEYFDYQRDCLIKWVIELRIRLASMNDWMDVIGITCAVVFKINNNMEQAGNSKIVQEALSIVQLTNICFNKCVVKHKPSTDS